MAFDPQEVARALREHRKAAGWTQAEVAERAGLAFETVSRLESGREPPSLRSAVALAEAFGSTLDAIVGRLAAPTPKPPRDNADVRRLLVVARRLDANVLRSLVKVSAAIQPAKAKPKPGGAKRRKRA